MRRLGAILVLTGAMTVGGGGAAALGPGPQDDVPIAERLRVAWHGGKLLDRATHHRQRARLDCGLAVALYVLDRFGTPQVRAVVASRLPRTKGGVRFADLAAVLRQYGIDGRLQQFASPPGRWPGPPAVLWLPPGHFVVLEDANFDSVVVFDPALGRVRFPAARFARRWTGAALCLSPPTGGES